MAELQLASSPQYSYCYWRLLVGSPPPDTHFTQIDYASSQPALSQADWPSLTTFGRRWKSATMIPPFADWIGKAGAFPFARRLVKRKILSSSMKCSVRCSHR